MATISTEKVGQGSKDELSLIGKLFDKAQKLTDTVPGEIRAKLAALSAEVNGKANELKQATKENAEKLKTEINELGRSTSQEYVREDKTAKLKKQFEKLLTNKQGFDSIRAGDIHRMRSSGENISNFLLTDEIGDEIDLQTRTIDIFKNKKLLVNFGVNKSINASIGLGDILPYEVRKVEITDKNGKTTIGTLGSEDSRNGRRSRVGYYDESGKYIAIYNGYSVKILETGTVSEEDKKKYESLQNEHMKNIRLNEMVDFCIAKNGHKKMTPDETKAILGSEFQDEKDILLFGEVTEKINTRIMRGEHIRDSYKDGIGSRDKFVGKFGWYMRDVIAKDFPNVPAYILVNLFDGESKFDPTAFNSSTNAYGLGQITANTFDFIQERMNQKYDRNSPYDQIHASAAYLNWIMGNNNCSIQDAMVYYHMGPNVKKLMDRNDQEWLGKYKKSNPAIVNLMKEDTWQGYWNAATVYYTKQPHLLTELDLSKTGTELATQLGDFVIGTSLPNTGTSSCGAAVGILLNRFGIESLPQSGRDGKNWDDILDPRVKNGQFRKIPIAHPSDASSGAILVYDGSGDLGSNANKSYGHVEIKGSDRKYYSYYEGSRAGGSAATSETDPENYRKLTGFTGYAYYPIKKQS